MIGGKICHVAQKRQKKKKSCLREIAIRYPASYTSFVFETHAEWSAGCILQ